MNTYVERLNQYCSSIRAEPHPDFAGFTDFAYRMDRCRYRNKGYTDFFAPTDDLLVSVLNAEMNSACREELPGMGRMVFLFHLAGSRIVEIEQEADFTPAERREIEEPTLCVMYLPEGVNKRTTFDRRGSNLAVGIGVWIKQLPEFIRDSFTVISKWNGGKTLGSDGYILERPLSFELAQAAHQLVSPQVHTSLLKHYVGNKANELLCLGMDALLPRDSKSGQHVLMQQKLSYVKSVLDSRLHNPPSLVELSAKAGLTTAQLSKALRDDTGFTLSQYLATRRMMHAKKLLISTDKSVKCIAYDLGYNHISNFCIAFKQHFGITPRQARKNVHAD